MIGLVLLYVNLYVLLLGYDWLGLIICESLSFQHDEHKSPLNHFFVVPLVCITLTNMNIS